MATNSFNILVHLKRAMGPGLIALSVFTLQSAQGKRIVTSEIKKADLDLSTQYWVEAFDFFQSENELAPLEALRTKALEKQHQNLKIIKKVLDSIIIAKDRNKLFESMLVLASKNTCLEVNTSPSQASPVCTEIQRLWTGHLDSLLFYEDSAAKIEKARRHLLQKECDKALSLIKEVELKEGPFYKLSELAHSAYTCLGDEGNRVSKQNEMQKLKIFLNYSS